MPCSRESIGFDKEGLRIDHHAVAEHTRLAAMHDAGRQADEARTTDRQPVPSGRRCARPGNEQRSRNCSASRSTILPFPSSPHWAPITAMTFDIDFLICELAFCALYLELCRLCSFLIASVTSEQSTKHKVPSAKFYPVRPNRTGFSIK